MFTHLYQRDHFSEEEVRVYIGEIILALEHLHKVRPLPPAPLSQSPAGRSRVLPDGQEGGIIV